MADTVDPETLDLDADGLASEGPAPQQGGPRIVINPSTFRNEKDALCVAFNEAFRIVMEEMQFDPVSEPTDAQRKFFSDTAYANDENQLRRTILARICTFDTSVKDPTDEQLEEAVEFLESVLEAGVPQNEWEQSAVTRIRDVVSKAIGAPKADEEEAPPEEAPPEEAPPEEAMQADEAGGDTDEQQQVRVDYETSSNLPVADAYTGGMSDGLLGELGGGGKGPGQVTVDYETSSNLPIADAEAGDGTFGLFGEYGRKRGSGGIGNGTGPINPAELENKIQEGTHAVRDAWKLEIGPQTRWGPGEKRPGTGTWKGGVTEIGPQTRWGPGEKRPH